MEPKDMICGNFYRITQDFGGQDQRVWLIRFEHFDQSTGYIKVQKRHCICVTWEEMCGSCNVWGIFVKERDVIEPATSEEIYHLLECAKWGRYVVETGPKKEDYPVW